MTLIEEKTMAALTTKRYPHEPDYVVTPGEILHDTIDALHMSQAELATRTGLSRKTINLIIQGHEPISHETALRLERVTRVPASFWNSLEAKYRERVVRREEKERLARDLKWLDTIPVKELIERGAIPEQGDRVALLDAVLAFFGVNSPKEWGAVWLQPQAHFRQSRAFNGNPGAVASWMRLGELAGQQQECQPFNKGPFKEALEEIRGLTVEGPEAFVPRMVELCAAAGVALVFVREIDGAPVSGACQWLAPDKALIQMTLRGKSDDLFWFTFFHEAGHILRHGKKDKFVDDGQGDDEKEEEANRFAEDILIPRSRVQELFRLSAPGEIIEFARSINIAPGVAVGRLQRRYPTMYKSPCSKLKRWFEWSERPGVLICERSRD
jgi:addiction module HigA family antidote